MSVLPTDCSPAACMAQLERKRGELAALLAPFRAPTLAVHASPPVHYRQRAEFRTWHEGDETHFLMFGERGARDPIRVTEFLPGSLRINALMRQLQDALRGNDELRRQLWQVDLLSTLSGEALLTLVYHRQLDEAWSAAARGLEQACGARIIGRARRQRVVLSEDFVTERLEVGGSTLVYRQPEGCFTQPNAEVNRAMLAWAATAAGENGGDLVELYCGIGNFTVALAPRFRRVLATEIGTTAIAAATHNLAANGIGNCFVARLSSAEAAAALARERPFRRLAGFDLEDFAPATLLVDPPRAGLDARTLEFAAGFPRILYISCNPHSLVANLHALGAGWRIERCALFDQFPYTPHMECGLVLERVRTAY